MRVLNFFFFFFLRFVLRNATGSTVTNVWYKGNVYYIIKCSNECLIASTKFRVLRPIIIIIIYK